MSLIPWHTTCSLSSDTTGLLSPAKLQVSCPSINDWSLIPWHYKLLIPWHITCLSLIHWHTTSPLSPDTLLAPYPWTLQVRYPLANYRVLIPWHTSPFSLDTLHVKSIIPWHVTCLLCLEKTTDPLSSDKIQIPHPPTHYRYLIPWHTTGSSFPGSNINYFLTL